jgi:hypothetical protein
MRAEGTSFSGNVALDLAVYDYARSVGNMEIMNLYADALYDSSGDYWYIQKGVNGEILGIWDDGNPNHVTIEDYDGTKKFVRLKDGSVSKALADAFGGGMTGEEMEKIMNASGLKYIDGKGWQAVDSSVYKRPEFSWTDVYRYLGLDTNAAEIQYGADINIATGMYIGEVGRDVIFEMISGEAKGQGLVGKKYSTKTGEAYVCTSFVEDMLYIMGLNQKEYLPGGQLVKDSIARLMDTIKPEAGINPSPGTYVFYKLYDNGIEGHTGIVSFNTYGSATILHNGSDGNQNLNVNIRIYNKDFNEWFRDDKKYPVIYKQIIPRR